MRPTTEEADKAARLQFLASRARSAGTNSGSMIQPEGAFQCAYH